MATATIGTLPEGAKTGAAVKTVKLLAQSTGEFNRDELKKDVKLSWTDKTREQIAAAKGGTTENGTTSGEGSNTNPTNPTNGGNGGGTGSVTPSGGGDNGGGSNTGGGDNGGGDNGGNDDEGDTN